MHTQLVGAVGMAKIKDKVKSNKQSSYSNIAKDYRRRHFPFEGMK